MQNNYYALAHEQAANERAEIHAQIEHLLARDAKLEKLVEALKDFVVADDAAGGMHVVTPAAPREGEHGHESDPPPAA